MQQGSTSRRESSNQARAFVSCSEPRARKCLHIQVLVAWEPSAQVARRLDSSTDALALPPKLAAVARPERGEKGAGACASFAYPSTLSSLALRRQGYEVAQSKVCVEYSVDMYSAHVRSSQCAHTHRQTGLHASQHGSRHVDQEAAHGCHVRPLAACCGAGEISARAQRGIARSSSGRPTESEQGCRPARRARLAGGLRCREGRTDQS